MSNEINSENLRNFLAVFIEKENLSLKQVAKSIGCSITTLERILINETLPTNELIKQVGILIAIGYDEYIKLSRNQKETISEKIGAIGAGSVGFASIATAVSASGVTIGLSAAGISAGLAAIGSIVGGGMIAGVTVVAAIPILAGAIGYGLIKGIKSVFRNKKTHETDIDSNWEISK
ncbi:MAG: hypothetical protein AB8G11_24145 [Saprospiraceae bacterium]